VPVSIVILSHGANIKATILPCTLGIFYFYGVVKQHIILAVLWIIFCVLHSLLASIKVKQWIAKGSGNFFKYFRLYYTLFAFINFAIVLFYQITIPSPYIFSPTVASYSLGIFMGSLGLGLMTICIKKYFANLSGLKTLFVDEIKTGNSLLITGVHRYMRHPLYTGTFLFIWGLFIFLPYASILISNFIITVYTLIGIRFEEEKLTREFGNSYEEYKKKVPKIIPSIRPLPASKR
jgi:protein-S-isoprenylcysteine O-methyltransferase Ste14